MSTSSGTAVQRLTGSWEEEKAMITDDNSAPAHTNNHKRQTRTIHGFGDAPSTCANRA